MDEATKSKLARRYGITGVSLALVLLSACAVSKLSVSSVEPLPLVAVPSSSLAGLVKDESNAPIIGAMIELKEMASKQRRFICSDAAGSFEFQNLIDGTYSLTVQAAGYDSLKNAVVNITGSGRTRVICLLVESTNINNKAMMADFPGMINLKSTSSGVVVYEDANGVLHVENE